MKQLALSKVRSESITHPTFGYGYGADPRDRLYHLIMPSVSSTRISTNT